MKTRLFILMIMALTYFVPSIVAYTVFKSEVISISWFFAGWVPSVAVGAFLEQEL